MKNITVRKNRAKSGLVSHQKLQGHQLTRAMTSPSSSMNVYVAAAGNSFVSQSGLVAVLKAVRKHGLPDAISRPTLKRRRAEAIPRETPVGPLWGSMQLLCEDNKLLELPVCNPYALLYVTLENCKPFREYFETVIGSVGNSAAAPLRIICYCDEILPGDQLKATNMRKLVAWYWSILDFKGQLGREQLWFQLTCCRTVHVKKVLGQYSQIWKKFANSFKHNPWTEDLASTCHWVDHALMCSSRSKFFWGTKRP